jgi:hypothetical protein
MEGTKTKKYSRVKQTVKKHTIATDFSDGLWYSIGFPVHFHLPTALCDLID